VGQSASDVYVPDHSEDLACMLYDTGPASKPPRSFYSLRDPCLCKLVRLAARLEQSASGIPFLDETGCGFSSAVDALSSSHNVIYEQDWIPSGPILYDFDRMAEDCSLEDYFPEPRWNEGPWRDTLYVDAMPLESHGKSSTVWTASPRTVVSKDARGVSLEDMVCTLCAWARVNKVCARCRRICCKWCVDSDTDGACWLCSGHRTPINFWRKFMGPSDAASTDVQDNSSFVALASVDAALERDPVAMDWGASHMQKVAQGKASYDMEARHLVKNRPSWHSMGHGCVRDES